MREIDAHRFQTEIGSINRCWTQSGHIDGYIKRLIIEDISAAAGKRLCKKSSTAENRQCREK